MLAQPCTRHICAGQGDVKHRSEQEQHERHAPAAAEQDAVEPAVAFAGGLRHLHAAERDLLGAQGRSGGDLVVQLLGGQAGRRSLHQCVQRCRPGQTRALDGVFDPIRIADGGGAGGRALFQHAAHRPGQLRQAAPLPRGAGHDRDAERVLECMYVNADVLAARLVHQVEAEHRAGGDLEHLQNQDQVALEAGRICDQNGHIRLARGEKVARRALFGRAGAQGIGTRQVDQRHRRAAAAHGAVGVCDRLAAPVAGVLAAAGEGIEHGRLADIGVARKGNHRRAVRGPQGAPPTSMRAASACRSAITAPRIR